MQRYRSSAAVAVPVAVLLGAAAPQPAPSAGDAPVPHRAVYRIALADTSQASSITSADGRMVFEIAGSACEGYKMSQRLVVRLGDTEGAEKLLDFRVSTFEAGAGDLFRFVSRTYVDDRVVEDVKGQATRTPGGVEVRLETPQQKTVRLMPATLFPGQHLIALLDAARADRRFLSAEIYEGSGTGDSSDTATAVIGTPANEPAGEALVRGIRSWPVSVAYFSKAEAAMQEGGEETPSYQMSFTLFENGVTKNLVMDYGDYALSGTLEEIEALAPAKCE